MSSLCERRALLVLLTKACGAGARLAPACAQIGLSERTVQRWQRPPASDDGDLRASSQRVATPPPPNRLSGTERRAAMALLNSDEFKDLPPSQIVPRLADQGRFVASESTLYRLLRSAGQLKHRCGERAPHKRSRPRALAATGPHQIYSWDITYLPTDVRGVYFYFYFYVFVDLFSRKLVGWQVYDCESANRAGELLTDIGARQRIAPQQLTLHSDNGSPMLATLQRLGVAGSRSRPSVSNDNPFSEALFRTLKLQATRQTTAKPAARTSLGDPTRALVQPRASAQRARLRYTPSASRADRSIPVEQPRQGLHSGSKPASQSVAGSYPKLDLHR